MPLVEPEGGVGATSVNFVLLGWGETLLMPTDGLALVCPNVQATLYEVSACPLDRPKQCITPEPRRLCRGDAICLRALPFLGFDREHQRVERGRAL